MSTPGLFLGSTQAGDPEEAEGVEVLRLAGRMC